MAETASQDSTVVEVVMSDGGRAFPVSEYGDDGLTKRDYFAAAALQGMLASASNGVTRQWMETVSKDAYAWSDAMLKARKESGNG